MTIVLNKKNGYMKSCFDCQEHPCAELILRYRTRHFLMEVSHAYCHTYSYIISIQPQFLEVAAESIASYTCSTTLLRILSRIVVGKLMCNLPLL
jgi:hypothetical protein